MALPEKWPTARAVTSWQMNRRQNQRKQTIYRIKVKGHLDPCWSEWFDGMTITWQGDGETILSGSVRDQAALHGLLAKIRDMGMALLLVEQLDASSGYGVE